jgi:hypothetical protein
MRTVLFLAFWPTLVDAQDVTRFAWGVPVEGSAPSLLSLEPCDLPCVAVVRFDNTLVTSGHLSKIGGPARMRTTLAVAGLKVAVTVENGGGMTPDLLRVLSPPGHWAEPRELAVDDNATGRVRLLLAPTS